MAGPFAPSGRRAAARRRTPGVLGPRARPRPRCGLGLGAALRAGLAARASAQPSPHSARAAWCCGRQGRGMPALRAGGGSRPRPLGASLPPPAACGPLPLPTLGGWSPPAPPACGGRGYVAAGRRLRRLRSRPCGACQPPAVARGHLPAPQGQAPFGGALRAALPRSSPSPVAASVLRAAPPPLVGAFGAVRPSGPGVPGSGQPPRAGPPAALPALARLCLR